jgi:hypothetical protein
MTGDRGPSLYLPCTIFRVEKTGKGCEPFIHLQTLRLQNLSRFGTEIMDTALLNDRHTGRYIKP